VVIDELARRHQLEFRTAPSDALIATLRTLGNGALVAKPLAWMNRSGEVVAGLARYYRIELADVLVVIDDINLPLGRLRARARGSAGGHNGLKSVIEQLGTEEVARLRLGVGRGDPRRDLADHVLATFDDDEQEQVASLAGRAADACEMFVTEGVEPVMNRFNKQESEDRSQESE
jgi:PTH1 family peptidyl-tRNA hydrolase